MIEIEGKTLEQLVSILVDLGSSLSYISPKMMEKCKLRTIFFKCMVSITRDSYKE